MNKSGKNFRLTYSSQLVILIVLVITAIAFAFLSPAFLSFRNFTSIARYTSIYGLVSIGMSFVIFNGKIDLSVGFQVGMISILLGYLMNYTLNVAVLIIAGIILGLFCGAVNGFFVAKVGLPAFVATIGLGQVYDAIGHLVANGTKILFTNEPFRFIGRYDVFGMIPLSFIVFIFIAIITSLVLKYTTFGRNIYAIGCNGEAAHLAGIKTERVTWKAYIVSGLLCGLAAVIATSQNGAGIVSCMDGSETIAISAVVLGGGSMLGGKGTIWGTIIGIFLLRVISNGMNLINLPTYWQMVTTGALLIIAVIVDSLKNSSNK